jgi:hypothetical protein
MYVDETDCEKHLYPQAFDCAIHGSDHQNAQGNQLP